MRAAGASPLDAADEFGPVMASYRQGGFVDLVRPQATGPKSALGGSAHAHRAQPPSPHRGRRRPDGFGRRLLVARIGLGVIMVAHAKLEYYFGGSFAGVGQLFDQSGVPLAAITGRANVLFELVGGIAMILGVAVRIVGVLMVLNMAGAWVFVHTSGLFAMDHNGPELVIALGLLSLVLAVTGAGRFGLDHMIVRRLRRTSRTST